MASAADFTATETCILSVLSDGMPHQRKDLLACLDNDFSDFNTVRVHLTNIRKKLPPTEDIIPQFHKRTLCYRHIVLLKPRRHLHT